MIKADNAIRYILNAATAEWVKPNDWKTWSDQLIAKEKSPEYWLIELSLTNSVEALSLMAANYYDPFVTRTEDADALIGYFWMRYIKGNITLYECLNIAGKASDNCGSSIQCEDFYALLNQLELSKDNEIVEKDARKLFSPCTILAKNQWAKLEGMSRMNHVADG